jgi:iron complex outermembrane recepter protein
MMRFCATFASLSVLACASLGMAPALAQEAEEVLDTGIADIIVTAEKRSTNIQDVPLSITAIGADELQNANVIGTRGLSGLAPNVNIGQDARGLIVSIRGVSSANVTFSRDPSVAFHVDGVYAPRPTGASGTFFDLDRVEILRGPQGTLYGRNSTGGTVNVITAKPNFDGVSGYANAS